MFPFVSIVIPAYNAGSTIIPLLSSIYHSQKADLASIEVIVVDDHSLDNTIDLINKFILNHPKLEIKILKLGKNKGPAHARNAGAKAAGIGKREAGSMKKHVIFFLDSDVVLHKKSLYELMRSFEDPDIHALTGVWDKKQRSHDFFPKFKALRDWSYWINERDPKHYYYLFSTRVAAIDRGLFMRLGGFDETYKAALVEDIELTYRIARRYAVVFNPKVTVYHEFELFWPIAKKYFWRSYYWSKIYRERKKFDPVATTNKEALTTVSAGAIAGLGVLSIVLGIMYYVLGIKLENFVFIKYLIINAFLLILLIHLLGVRKFLWFCYKEEGIVFALKAFITGFILYLVILSGAGLSMFS